jgi:catalase
MTTSSHHPFHRVAPVFVALTTSAAILISGTALAAPDSPPEMVDALHSAFGVHHARAVHAKGVILEGSFAPSAEATNRSKASLFAGPSVPVTVRFSDFTGIPDIPDTVGDANPRGFAIKFRPADGNMMDIVTHGFNGFPTATADEFGQLLRAIGASGQEAAKPIALDQFLSAHPIAKKFLTTQKPAPVSYGTLTYFGVNAFKFTNAQNTPIFVRYRFVPKAGEQFLDAAALKAKGPNYLAEEIAARIAKAAVVFDWYAQISGPGDAVADPSVAWPENRTLVKLGTISIKQMAPDQATADKATLFLPGNLPAGIEAADPMIAIRSAAYPLSFRARQ